MMAVSCESESESSGGEIGMEALKELGVDCEPLMAVAKLRTSGDGTYGRQNGQWVKIA
jgi:hypothetical protein